MREHVRDLRHEFSLPGPLLDVDGSLEDQWVGIASTSESKVLVFGGAVVAVPRPIRFLCIRLIDRDRAFLVDTRSTVPGQVNAWVIDRQGQVHAQFAAGDGVEDVLASEDFLIVTYFDEGVFGREGPNREGLCVFTLSGDMSIGFRSMCRGPDIADCYSACWVSSEECAFIPYVDFPFVRLNVRTKATVVCELPEALHGPSAVSVRGEDVLLWSPFSFRRSLIRWRVGEPEFEKIGEHAGPLRGLVGGAFLSAGTGGYTVLEPLAS